MTTQTITTTPGLVQRLGDAIAAFGRFLAENSEAMRAAREAERLFQLSDDELARRGLTRDRVVHHAFRRYLHQ